MALALELQAKAAWTLAQLMIFGSSEVGLQVVLLRHEAYVRVLSLQIQALAVKRSRCQS